MQINEKALRAAFAVNHHPDSEPSETELAKLRRSILAYESAKPKEAEGLNLGSRLTVEGVEAVVVPVNDLLPIAAIANNYDGMFEEPDVPILAVGTARFRLNNARSIRAMLSAAGDGR